MAVVSKTGISRKIPASRPLSDIYIYCMQFSSVKWFDFCKVNKQQIHTYLRCLWVNCENGHIGTCKSMDGWPDLHHGIWVKYTYLFQFNQFLVNWEWSIKLICPWNEDPLTPHFYMLKLGFTGVYISVFFLFLLLT